MDYCAVLTKSMSNTESTTAFLTGINKVGFIVWENKCCGRRREGGGIMRIQLKPYAWVLALVVGTGIIGGATRTIGFPPMNAAGADQGYSKNSRYQQGQREGKG